MAPSTDEDDFPDKTPVSRISRAIMGIPPAPPFPPRVRFKLRRAAKARGAVRRLPGLLLRALLALALAPYFGAIVLLGGGLLLIVWEALGPAVGACTLGLGLALLAWTIVRRRSRDGRRRRPRFHGDGPVAADRAEAP